jgi:hypothetical protein
MGLKMRARIYSIQGFCRIWSAEALDVDDTGDDQRLWAHMIDEDVILLEYSTALPALG